MGVNLFKAIRPFNLCLVAFIQSIIIFGFINPIFDRSNIETNLSPKLQIGLIICTVLMAAGAYLINDYFDIDTDAFNQKSKELSEKTLLFSYLATSIIGLLLAIYIAIQVDVLPLLPIYFVALFLLFIYSKYLKSSILFGNIIVALFAAFIIGIIAISEWDQLKLDNNSTEWSQLKICLYGYMIFSFLTHFIREIAKDVVDIKGDQSVGILTFPIQFGLHKSKIIINLFLIILLIFTILWVYTLSPYITSLMGLVAFILLILPNIYLIQISKISVDHFSALETRLKLYMVLGLLYLIILSFQL